MQFSKAYATQCQMLKAIALLLFGFFLSQIPQTSLAETLFVAESTSQKCHAQADFNFGVLIYNPYYKIYRSTGLGEAGLFALQKHLSENHLEYPNRVIYLNRYGYEPDKVATWKETQRAATEKLQTLFHFVRGKITQTPVYHLGTFASEEEALSQPQSQGGLAFNFEFIHGGNRNVYISGENPLIDSPKAEKFAQLDGTLVSRAGGKSALYQVLKEILTSDHPVHFHCKGGIHRTGMVGLMIRYLQGGYWTDVKPPQELQKMHVTWLGVPTPQEVEIRNLAEFEYIQHNPSRIRPENLDAIRRLSQERQFRCLKKNFSYYLNFASDPVIDCYPRETRAEHPQKEFNRNRLWDECIQ